MTNQTRICRNLLRLYFPSVKFSIRLIRAKNYLDSSDKLEIRYDADVPMDRVMEVLRTNTRGIKTDRIGKVQISSSDKFEMYNPETGRFEDMDLCEFIEVGYLYE